MKLKIFIPLVLLVLSNTTFAEDRNATTKITDNVYSHFSGYYTSLIVVGDEGVLITDPANSYRAASLKRAIEKITSLPVTHVVLSHEHYDHVGGTELFDKAEVIIQEKALPVFKLDVLGMAPKSVSKTFKDKYTVNMGKTSVEVLHFGFPSDGIANSVIHLPNERLVFSADFYEDNEIVSKKYIDAFNVLGARATLNKLVELNPKYAIASHSPNADVQDLKIAAAFYNDLYAVTKAELDTASVQGYEAIQAFSATFPQKLRLEKYKHLNNYEDLFRHAERMIESILHGG